MQTVLEFPAKVFAQWGAVAQEIVPYLTQRGVKRDEICAVLERLRIRWEQLGPASTHETDTAWISGDDAACSMLPDERAFYVSRHWRSQSARMLIAEAMTDHLRHVRR